MFKLRQAALRGALLVAKLVAQLVALAAVSFAAAAPAWAADTYPSQPVHLVVGFPPGGSNDIVARILAPRLAQVLGVSVIVENRPGANATIGTEYTVRARPDGYTITLGSASPLAISPHTYPNLPYDPLKDLTGVTTVAATPELLAVNPKLPVHNLAELVALAKTRNINIGSSGNGGLPHLAIELLKIESKGQIVHVPYKGAGPATGDAVGGQIDGILVDLPALYSMVDAGQLRAIVVTNDHRAPVLPNTPTSIEGGLPAVQAVNWFAVMAPPHTPKPIVDTLYAALIKTMAAPDVKANLAHLGIEPFTQPSPQAFDAFMKTESVRWGKVATASGAKIE